MYGIDERLFWAGNKNSSLRWILNADYWWPYISYDQQVYQIYLRAWKSMSISTSTFDTSTIISQCQYIWLFEIELYDFSY